MKQIKDVFWSLYFQPEGIQVDGLRTLQLQGLLRCVHPDELGNWMVWGEGTEAWRPAADIIQDLSQAQGLKRLLPFAPPMRKEFVPSGTNEGEKTDLETIELRMNIRFKARFKVALVYEGEHFDNHTVDISLTGMRLEEDIPAHVNGEVPVILYHDSIALHIQCRVLFSQGEKNKRRLSILVCNRNGTLRSWILSAATRKAI